MLIADNATTMYVLLAANEYVDDHRRNNIVKTERAKM
jgi:hypothetical protein